MTQKVEQINQWFRMFGTWIIKLRWLMILLILALNVIAIIGMKKIRVDTSNDAWFFEKDALKIATDEFNEIFGNNSYPAILVEADDVFAPEILQMIRVLGNDLTNEVPYADEIYSLTDAEFTMGTEEGLITEPIVPDEIPTTPEAIEATRKKAFSKEFMINRLFSDDSKMTWIMLRLHRYPDQWEGKVTPEEIVGAKVNEIVAREKYQKFNLKTVGMPILNVEKREYVMKQTGKMMGLSLIIAVVVLLIFLHSVRGLFVPLFTAFSSIVFVLGANGLLGIPIDPMVVQFPMFLILAVSIGYSIHVFNFFNRRFRITGKRKESILYAIEHTGWPLLFTALTTMGAMSSFLFIPIRQVAWIGGAAAGAVATAYIIVMLLTPALLSFGRDRKPEKIKTHTGKGLHWSERVFASLSDKILTRPIPIISIFVIIIVVFAVGLPKLEVDMTIESQWGDKVTWASKMDYVRNTKLGTLYSFDATITFDEPDRVKDPEVLRKFDRFAHEVNDFRLIKRVSSLLDIIKDLNQVLHSDSAEYYRIPDSPELVSQLLLLYEMSGGTQAEHFVDYDYQRLRLTAEVEDFSSKEFEYEVDYMEKRVKELFPDATLGIIGSAVQYSVMGNYVARGAAKSFLIALCVIMIIMMLVFRNIKTGLIGMIPNITPVIIVGGYMGLFHIPLDMMTMIIMPMLLGLAVDDTIHFLNHTKLEFERSGKYASSIKETFVTVGKALFMTSFILICSFAVYLTSNARIYIHIGLLSILGIASALLADYFITPVLIKWTKPFGKEK